MRGITVTDACSPALIGAKKPEHQAVPSDLSIGLSAGFKRGFRIYFLSKGRPTGGGLGSHVGCSVQQGSSRGVFLLQLPIGCCLFWSCLSPRPENEQDRR